MSNLLIEPADTFGKHWEEIKSDASISREYKESILNALVEAINLFRQSRLNMDAPPFHKVFGNAYSYRFHPNYVITFKRKETTNKVTLRLHTIQRK
jgi:hypothetical protein